MATNLNHVDWVKQQFDKYLNKSYRDVFVHSSMIEGILINESGKDSFDTANKALLLSNKINSSEFCVFNELRKIRNTLSHNIFKNNGLPQKEIDKLRNMLMTKILEAYSTSKFLDAKLIMKYQITRSPKIPYNPIQ